MKKITKKDIKEKDNKIHQFNTKVNKKKKKIKKTSRDFEDKIVEK